MAGPNPLRITVGPHGYLEAIVRRARRVTNVHRVRGHCYQPHGARQAVLRITYKNGDPRDPDPDTRESIDRLRREFSSAFPEWWISVEWSQHDPYRVKPVEKSQIVDGWVIQTLACGHRVKGEKLRSKRICGCCSAEAEDGDS